MSCEGDDYDEDIYRLAGQVGKVQLADRGQVGGARGEVSEAHGEVSGARRDVPSVSVTRARTLRILSGDNNK